MEADFGCLYCDDTFPTYDEVDEHINANHAGLEL
jgi:hypothetical protein